MMTLEKILQIYFGCKKPFLKRRKLTGYNSDGLPDYDYFTHAGVKAYEKLVCLVGDVGSLVEAGHDAEHWVEVLDQIVKEDY